MTLELISKIVISFVSLIIIVLVAIDLIGTIGLWVQRNRLNKKIDEVESRATKMLQQSINDKYIVGELKRLNPDLYAKLLEEAESISKKAEAKIN